MLISGYGDRERDHHDGIDLAAPEGAPVHAAESGVVLFSGERRGYGNIIVLAHDNDLVTVYAHNAENLVSRGDRVSRGAEIARVGRHYRIGLLLTTQSPSDVDRSIAVDADLQSRAADTTDATCWHTGARCAFQKFAFVRRIDRDDNPRRALAERAGLAFSASAFRHGDMDLIFTDSSHPITKGFTHLRLTDESYWALRGDPTKLSVLAISMEDKQPRPQIWTLQRHKGRVLGCIPGHYTWTFDDPLYRVLVLRGIAWTAGLSDIDRLVELAPIGARIAP